jgi:hypothetical protein
MLHKAHSKAAVALLALALLIAAVAGHGRLSWAAPHNATSAKHVYLPFIMKPAAPPAGLGNGNFEAGRTGWTEYSARNAYPLIGRSFPSGIVPHSGSYAVWLGGLKNETSYIEQRVTVSAAAPYLAYWRWIASVDYCGYDFGQVLVNGALVERYNLCIEADTHSWVKRVLNLSAYAGQSVTLRIQATTDFSRNSNLFIDDVAFQTAPGLAAETEPLAAPDAPQPKDGAPAPSDPDALPKAALELAEDGVPAAPRPKSEAPTLPDLDALPKVGHE